MPYLIGAFALAVLLVLAFNTSFKRPRKLDERITLREHDKIPYGTFVAHQLLKSTFSKAHVSFDKASPGYWNDINTDTSNQAVFLICGAFEPDRDELKRITQFVQAGNFVFLITQNVGWETGHYFKLRTDKRFFMDDVTDSLQLSLNAPFIQTSVFIYPGKKYSSYFSDLDSATGIPLGGDASGHTNFIQLQSGNGKLFIHLAPLAFSNYFILHKSNVRYFQALLSLLPQHVDKIVWNEYYLSRHPKHEAEPNVLSVLWQHQSFRWALLTIIITLLLYVASAARRSQRLIPAFAKPANDSLDFVRTMGRLYYDRRDHHNLSKKMAAFFLEHARSRYQILNQTADDSFVDELHQKSGYAHEDLKKLVAFIQYINTYTFITEAELARFYRQLYHFYKNTHGTIV